MILPVLSKERSNFFHHQDVLTQISLALKRPLADAPARETLCAFMSKNLT
jgi:hypothetical protein